MASYLDPYEIASLYKLTHIQLDHTLRKLKQKIDLEFEEFRETLVASLNHLNYLRYHEAYPADDFHFVFKEKVNASKVESRLEQKQETMKRMQNFAVIKQDSCGVADNCLYEIQERIKKRQQILDFKQYCPSGVSFLAKHQSVITKFIEFWKSTETGGSNSMKNLFQEASPVFSRSELSKLGVIFSQQNKRIASTKLLFRASQYNFQSALFKQHCAGEGPTLLIVKSDKGCIFGGYTPAKWLNTKEKEYVADPTSTSFLFSLDHNLVFPIKKNQVDYAISAYGGWGPIYGSPYGPDLSIADKCHINDNSCSSLGSHYDVPVSIKEYSQEAFSLLAGSKKFKVVEYQVYAVHLQ